ncbi:MAG TPA: protein kinase [Polyangiaceae bacterium]|nr:protein kinase [Polyangiaceae bacterium]
MRGKGYFLEGLLDLARLDDRAARRSSWRQSIVSLGQAGTQHGPSPLEGLDPAALVPAVRVALSDGLVDELDWLSSEAAAVALYEIAAALPHGQEKRELGRRVAAYTYDGVADTFAAVATRMALGSGKALAGPAVRARVALALELPSETSKRVDVMALALASRRDLVRDWIARPARGSLPARRLAGRLIERAASELSHLASQGDVQAVRVFRTEALAKAYQELLWDREPLVWKHAAVARGLLVGAIPELATEIDEHLSLDLSPTQWRRAATSLGASIASDPPRVVRRVNELLAHRILERDYGVAGCLVWGLAHAARLDPEAAEQALHAIVVRQGTAVAEAVEEGAREEPEWLRTRACQLLRRHLKLELLICGKRADDGAASLAAEILRDLEDAPRSESVRRGVAEALLAFGTQGSRRALDLAKDTLGVARAEVARLVAASQRSELRTVFAILRDLDMSLLESAVFANLLALDLRTADQGVAPAPVEELRDQLGSLFVGWEASAPVPMGGKKVPQANIRMRRLKAFIHLLDVDGEQASESSARGGAVRVRWLRASHTLLRRLSSDPPSVFDRSMVAALARALDGLVRAEMCDAVDALLFVAQRLHGPGHFATLKEAAKHPDLALLFERYERFARAELEARKPAIEKPLVDEASPSLPLPFDRSSLSIPAGPDGLGAEPKEPKDELSRRLAALSDFAHELSGENSSREEALRAVLVRLVRALEKIARASSLAELSSAAPGTESTLASLEEAIASLGQMVTAARLRLSEGETGDARSAVPGRGHLSALLRIVDLAVTGQGADFTEAMEGLPGALVQMLPGPLASLIMTTLQRVPQLPIATRAPVQQDAAENLLPSWIPPRRTLGGFYVLRSLGKGGVGSVFVVKRIEERNDPQAESFALKVPEYDAQAARHMSETDFLRMFQSEATALLSLPLHPNLARFVTFDLAARPKPVLVMELVDGVTLETFLARRQLTARGALELVDGLLAGLEAMHSVGVAHLDLKPTNVVMRSGREPVLVDFGLAGRHIRLGCGSGAYGAPEVWGYTADDGPLSPMPTDVYAAACLTYETLTAQALFTQESEVALISAHVTHDGWPNPLRALHQQAVLAPLAMLLGRALRRTAKDRIDVTTFRKELRSLAPGLSALPWPFLT